MLRSLLDDASRLNGHLRPRPRRRRLDGRLVARANDTGELGNEEADDERKAKGTHDNADNEPPPRAARRRPPAPVVA